MSNDILSGWDGGAMAYVPEKVFIEKLDPAPSAEYSEDRPSKAQQFEDVLNGIFASQNYMELFYMLPELYAPAHEIASRVSDAVFRLCTWNTDEVIGNDSDFNRITEQPNIHQTWRSLIYQAVLYEIVVGKQFYYKLSPSSLPANALSSVAALWNLPAHRTTATLKKVKDPYGIVDIRDAVENYKVPDAFGGYNYYTTENVYPIANYSLSKPLDINAAVSQFKGAEKAIKNLLPVYEARGTIFIKRGSMGFWVSRKKDADGIKSLTPAEKKEANDELNSSYGLTGDRATVGITAAPIAFERSQMSIQEMQPFDETVADAVAIYAVLRVPRHLVPTKDKSTYANASEDMKNFYADVIIPTAQRHADVLTKLLGLSSKQNYKKWIRADFSHIPILQEDEGEKADAQKKFNDVFEQRFLAGVNCLNDWIISTGGESVEIPVYKKKIGEMTAEELEIVKGFLNLKGISKPAAEPVKDKKEEAV